MAAFIRCPHCLREGVHVVNGAMRAHSVKNPVKTWIRRDGIGHEVMIDVYPRCEWSEARVLFPNGAK